MPELPDLEVYRENLYKRLSNRELVNLVICKSKRLNVTPKELADNLVGAILKSVERNGKEITMNFSNSHALSVHLMLKGKFGIVSDESTIKHGVASLLFKPNIFLVISDPRGLTTLTLDAQATTTPDALSSSFTIDYLERKLKKCNSKCVKSFLIDQNIIKGIGNAYADEILWASRISPESLCGQLPEELISVLFEKIKDVLIESIKQIKIKNPAAISGEIRDFFNIHDPERASSPTGRPIICKKIASKKTYFTDEQLLYK